MLQHTPFHYYRYFQRQHHRRLLREAGGLSSVEESVLYLYTTRILRRRINRKLYPTLEHVVVIFPEDFFVLSGRRFILRRRIRVVSLYNTDSTTEDKPKAVSHVWTRFGGRASCVIFPERPFKLPLAPLSLLLSPVRVIRRNASVFVPTLITLY